ncbi:hypothetical protein [Domibacillus enclensis]|uniref:Uncharacterized protein n=1 Tax=Domibacillus enclensis TaxID=1017273 RepID=A0A1N6RDH7_9BACI|nr:hypothetical protein [Domibacillus enclensis]SIQ26918.1 hypothetical protein SAMN05443094_10293 [Domibacillus enclensis]
MKIFTFFYGFLANGDANKEVSHNLTDSFTGIESYWTSSSK